jgi:hypothetical protein
VKRLAVRVRAIVDWYSIYEDFHVQYKHGLKLAARPYGDPTQETIEERRRNVKGPLLAFTTDPIEKMITGPQQQQGLIFPNLIPEAREHLSELVADRAMLRYKMSGPEVDLDEVVATSRRVLKLLRVAATNRTRSVMVSTRTARSASIYQETRTTKRSRSSSSWMLHPNSTTFRSDPAPIRPTGEQASYRIGGDTSFGVSALAELRLPGFGVGGAVPLTIDVGLSLAAPIALEKAAAICRDGLLATTALIPPRPPHLGYMDLTDSSKFSMANMTSLLGRPSQATNTN